MLYPVVFYLETLWMMDRFPQNDRQIVAKLDLYFVEKPKIQPKIDYCTQLAVSLQLWLYLSQSLRM